MGRRIKALEAVREGAVAFLYEKAADGHRLTLPRRVAEESGTVRQLLLSRGV